jgi:uncharacterized membrane protein
MSTTDDHADTGKPDADRAADVPAGPTDADDAGEPEVDRAADVPAGPIDADDAGEPEVDRAADVPAGPIDADDAGEPDAVADGARPVPPSGLAAARRHLAAIGSRVAPLGQPPRLVLLGIVAVWLVTFSVLVVWRHDRYGSFDFDLGIWDQSIWLLAHNGGLNTVRGLHVLSHHFTPALYFYVPFYWLGAGPNFLNVTMVAAVCAGAIVLFDIGRHHLRDEWHALVPATAFLVSYTAQWLLQETFHPEVMAVPFLLLAYAAAVRGRWRLYAAAVVLAVLWKEDIVLAAGTLGLVLALRGRRTVTGDQGPARTRAAGLITLAACAAYFVVVTQLVIPHFSEGENFTEAFFGDLGSSSPEIVKSMLTRPDLVLQHLEQSNPRGYVWNLAAPFGFVPLLSPLALLIGLPQAAVNLLATQSFFWSTKVHYATVPLVAMAVAAVEGVARFRWPPARRLLLGAMAVGAFFTAVSWGVSPLSEDFRSGYWPLEVPARQAVLDRAVALPDPDDGVSVMYNLTPHLTHRREAYTFPNPWIASNWAVAGENRPDPGGVDWIIVIPAALNDADRGTLATALRDPDRLLEPGQQDAPPPAERMAQVVDPSKWTVVMDDEGVFAVRRVRP